MTNEDRAETAELTLEYFNSLCNGDDDTETAAIDLICDIRHLLHIQGADMSRVLDLSGDSFEGELLDEASLNE